MGLIASLIHHPRETIAFATLVIAFNAMAAHPLASIAGIGVILLIIVARLHKGK
jgi:hypothetical protein